jgi:serine/threonine protein kinase
VRNAWAMFPVGSMVAGYRIQRVLGVGGMATVYLAKNPTLPREDALKVLSAALSRDPSFRERFVREADVASVLDHPNIVSVYGRGETDDGQLWIAMQYVPGTDAEAALRAGTMTPTRAIRIVGEVAKALDYAHQRNVVHQDVKPANFLLSDEFGDDEEHVLLGDFGVARTIDDAETPATALLTATLAYAAPEVIAGERIDGRADLYSLGCTLFRLLTGRQPFRGADGPSATAMAHLDQAPPRVSDHLCWAPAQLDWVIAKALAKDPAERFASAREFAGAAAEALRDVAPPVPVPPPTPGDQQPSPPPAPPPPADAGWDPLPVEGLSSQLALPVVKPKPARRVSKRLLLTGAAASAVVAVAAVALGAQRHTPAPPGTGAPTASTPTPARAQAQTRLAHLLPAGYPPGSCAPASVAGGATAAMSCAANTDPDGPSSATYLLTYDGNGLRAAFDHVVGSSVTVTCPGGIQSPGPWRRDASPTVPRGTVFCGVRAGRPLVAWTNDAELLLNVVEGAAPGPTLEQLYRWWSSHS